MLKNRKRWIEWLIKQDKNLKFQIGERKDWLDYNENMVLHFGSNRTLCHNEIVFDIDWKPNNVNSPKRIYPHALRQAIYLEQVLKGFGIPFIRCFSGRLFHYHIFLVPEWKELIKPFLPEDSEDMYRMFKAGIIQYVEKYLTKDVYCDIDKGIVSAKRHMIRMIGSLNSKTNNYKNYLPDGLPKYYPNFNYEDIVYPDPKCIEFWKPSKLIIVNVISSFIERNTIPKQPSAYISYRNGSSIKWIEDILRRNDISDGRSRLLGLVIVPYLKNIKGLDNESVVNICRDWLRRQPNLNKNQKKGNKSVSKNEKFYLCIVKSCAKCLDKKLKEGQTIYPQSEEKFKNINKDLLPILDNKKNDSREG